MYTHNDYCYLHNCQSVVANVNILNRDTGRNQAPFLFGCNIYISGEISRRRGAKFFQIYDALRANSSPCEIEFAAKGCRNFPISE